MKGLYWGYAQCDIFDVDQKPLLVVGHTTVAFQVAEHPMTAEVEVSPEIEGLVLGARWMREHSGTWTQEQSIHMVSHFSPI